MSELSHDSDAAFHEIQLSGKQLVFLFMATTVVSVVIFLCGVLVGRGVRMDAAPNAGASGEGPVAGTPAAAARAADAAPLATEPPAAVPEPGLSYPDRLNSAKEPREQLKPQIEARRREPERPQPEPAPAVRETAPPPAAPAAAPEPAARTTNRREVEPTTAVGSKPPRQGQWVVQVQALKDRGEAAAIVRRLEAKGYPAFLAGPMEGMYRVQVGGYADRAEAERVATRLKQEEKFSPWVRR